MYIKISNFFGWFLLGFRDWWLLINRDSRITLTKKKQTYKKKKITRSSIQYFFVIFYFISQSVLVTYVDDIYLPSFRRMWRLLCTCFFQPPLNPISPPHRHQHYHKVCLSFSFSYPHITVFHIHTAIHTSTLI